jgi:GNAT superfamily N-acetyltransferase
MLSLEELNFQLLDLDGVKTLVGWARDEGWNPSPYDADVFWATDPNGFYGYYWNGKLIAGGAIVSYQGEFGFMGLFIVKQGFRNQGIGEKLWFQRRDTLLKRLKKGASIGMDGVVAMQPFYEKGGFKIAFRDERYEKIGEEHQVDANISSMTNQDFSAILAYDQQCFGVARSQFLKPWLRMPDSKTFKYVENGDLKGFAVIRKVNIGYKICPLFADNERIAEELYKACLNAVIGKPLYFDVPVVHKGVMNIIKKYNAKYVFECARMYYGNPPKVALDKVFGITTFELG